jgi:hypothetical protein
VHIPWRQLTSANKVSQADKKLPGYLNLAAMGEPQLVLQLAEPVVVHGLLGRTKIASLIGLSVDNPAAFLAAVQQRLVEGDRQTGPGGG